MNKATFTKKAKSLHQSKTIGYSKVSDEVNLNSLIVLQCKEHGSFKIKAGEHLKGKGCPECVLKSDSIFTSPQAYQNTKKFFIEEIKPSQKLSNELVDVLKQSSNFDYFFYNFNDRSELFKEYYKNNPNAIDTLIKAKQEEGQKLKVVFTEKIMKLMKLK
jgi:hypothetical protein